MSDPTSNQTAPQNVPVPNPALIELLGGKFATGLLAVALVAVVLVDTLLLPTLMGMQSTPLFFADPCRVGEAGPAGGFGITLCAILALGLLGQHLFSRHSFFLTGFFALLFLIIGFVLIVQFGSLNGLLSGPNALKWYRELPSLGCPESRTLDQIGYARYQAVKNITVAFPGGGVQKTFTDMLQLNLFIGALLVGLIWVAGSIGWVWRKITSRGSPAVGQTGRIQTSRLGLPERSILFQSAVLTLLAVLAMPIILLFVTRPRAAAETVQDVIWIPALLFLLDLARWAIATASDALKQTQKTVVVTQKQDLFLKPVVNSLQRKFSAENRLLIDLPADENAPAADAPLPALRPGGHGLIIEETLSRRHLDLIAKTVNEQILDRGHTVLVICPQEHLDRIETLFARLLGSGHTRGPRPRIWRVGGDAKRPEGAVDVLLTSQFSLETLAANVENYPHELRLLGGIVALNLHDADFGLLDVSLDRLKPAVPNRDKLIGIFQSEPRGDMITRVENFSIIQGDKKPRPATTSRFERAMPQWIMVMDCKEGAQLNAKASLPVGFRALIEVAGQPTDLMPFVFDATPTYAALNWQNISERLLTTESTDLLARLDAIPHSAILPEATPHSVSLVDDKGNLADAMAVTTSAPAALEALKIVTLGAYPMARFFAKQLENTLATARDSKTKREALKSFNDRYGSLASNPRQGPRELATKIRMTFRAEANKAAAQKGHDSASEAMKLSQNKVAAFLDRPSRALRNLRVNISKGGMQRLFRTAFRLTPSEKVVSVRAADAVQATNETGRLRIKNYVLSGPPAMDRNAVPVLAIRGQAGQDVPLADHGLTYATGTRLWIGGNFQTIEEVNLNSRVIACSSRNSAPLHPYQFSRDYALQLGDSSRENFAAEGFYDGRTRRQPFELITGYVDCAARTYRAYEYSTMRFPFGASNQGKLAPIEIKTLATSETQFRSATLLRVLGDIGKPLGTSGRPNRGIARALTGSAGGQKNQANMVFTLSMTLQDVLATQFPSHAHRLAVICPQASQVSMLPDPAPLDNFVIERLRHMVGLGQNGLPIERAKPGLVPANVAQAYEDFSLAFSQQGRSGQGDTAASNPAQYSLLLIEDSDHDLGVAQSFFDHRDRIFVLWRDFLAHCVANSATPEETGYDFGTGQLPAVFDFKGALSVVEALCETKR